MKKSYEQLEKSVMFYRWLIVAMVAFIVFIGMNNISTTDQARKFEKQLHDEQVKNGVLVEQLKQFKDALCLPRIEKFDKEMGLS